jgi:hypothetical protein
MRKIILFITLMSFWNNTQACDICWCANGGSFMGLLPNMNQQLVGIRYFSKTYNSHLSSKFLGSREHFQTAELSLRTYPFKNLQMIAFLPYKFNEQVLSYDGQNKRNEGFGDARVLFHYDMINTAMDTLWLSDFNHQLLIGGGVKAPTGKFKFNRFGISEVANANFQLGTGSWDFPIQVIYTLQHSSMGFNLNATYQLNCVNENDYRFANRTVLAATLFKSLDTQRLTILPLVGLYVEQAGMDMKSGVKNEFTGGWLAALNTGIEVYTPRYNLSANAQLPMTQNLSDGELEFKSMFSVGISSSF